MCLGERPPLRYEFQITSEQDLKTLARVEVDELQVLLDATNFLREQLGVQEVRVFKAEDATRYDPQDRAKLATPMRPAIFVE